MNQLKTLEEHIQSVEELARFSFFYAAKYLKNGLAPEEPLWDSICNHTMLMFHGLEFRNKEEFPQIALCELMRTASVEFSGMAPEDFEVAMWERCGRGISERAGELYGKSRGVWIPPGWNCGSLKYDVPSAEEPELCRFHIYNTVSPNSLFADKEYLILCFKLLMKECELRFNANTLVTSTWLNDRPRWLEFFPEEFRDSLTPRHPEKAPGPTVGSWGFLYDARGCMNQKYIRQIRENGQRPFLARTGRCSFEAMRRHLETLI